MTNKRNDLQRFEAALTKARSALQRALDDGDIVRGFDAAVDLARDGGLGYAVMRQILHGNERRTNARADVSAPPK